MKREQFYAEHAKHLKDKPKEIALRDGYEMHYPNGDVYKYREVLKPGRTPSRWSGSYFADDFEYYCYWNGELITDTID
jgi:hypothetical protein